MCGVRTRVSPPAGDAAGVIGLEELCRPRHTDGADGRVVHETFVLKWKFFQLQQSDVVLIGRRVETATVIISDFNIQ